jgi:hypothetical protein
LGGYAPFAYQNYKLFFKVFFFWVDAKPLLWFGIAIGDVINGVITTLNYNHTN